MASSRWTLTNAMHAVCVCFSKFNSIAPWRNDCYNGKWLLFHCFLLSFVLVLSYASWRQWGIRVVPSIFCQKKPALTSESWLWVKKLKILLVVCNHEQQFLLGALYILVQLTTNDNDIKDT